MGYPDHTLWVEYGRALELAAEETDQRTRSQMVDQAHKDHKERRASCER